VALRHWKNGLAMGAEPIPAPSSDQSTVDAFRAHRAFEVQFVYFIARKYRSVGNETCPKKVLPWRIQPSPSSAGRKVPASGAPLGSQFQVTWRSE